MESNSSNGPLSDFDADVYWMGRALEMAFEAATADEVPVGALIVREGSIIAAANNQREMLKDPTAHAEMIAITQAASAINDWRLEETTLYVTLEPCVMCAGAILQSRIPRLVFGAMDPKGGAVTSLYQVLSDPRLNHQTSITSRVLAEPCGKILTEFFASQRAFGQK